MIIYNGRLLKKSSCKNLKLVLLLLSMQVSTMSLHGFSNIAFHLLPILLLTLVAINSESYGFIPNIISKLLCATIWSGCANLFKSEQMHFCWIGCPFRSAALHSIQLGTCCFVPTGYAQYLLKDQLIIERLSKRTSLALLGNNFLPIPLKISFHMKKLSDWLLP